MPNYLIGDYGEHNGRTIPIPPQGLTIGRGSACDLHLRDTQVSRQHASIVPKVNGNLIQDLGSKAGVFVNGVRVSQQILHHGDRITIGSNGFIFHEIRGEVNLPSLGSSSHGQTLNNGSNASNMSRAEIDVLVARRMALTRTFTGSAWVTFAMYFFGVYLIGLILNIIYLGEAKQIEKDTGITPEGKGCLDALAWVFIYIPLVIVGIALILALITGAGIFEVFGNAFSGY